MQYKTRHDNTIQYKHKTRHDNTRQEHNPTRQDNTTQHNNNYNTMQERTILITIQANTRQDTRHANAIQYKPIQVNT